EAEPDPTAPLDERQPLAARHVRPQLAAGDDDAELGGRPLEDDPLDVALDDVLEPAVLAVLDDDQVLRAEVHEDVVANAHARSEATADLESADVDAGSRRIARSVERRDGSRQGVVRADELGDERGLGPEIDLGLRPDLLGPAGIHDDDPI